MAVMNCANIGKIALKAEIATAANVELESRQSATINAIKTTVTMHTNVVMDKEMTCLFMLSSKFCHLTAEGSLGSETARTLVPRNRYAGLILFFFWNQLAYLP